MKIEFPADKDRLNREDLVTILAARLNVSEERAEEILVETLGVVIAIVHSGRSLLVTGFGTFSPLTNRARKARNPQTGEVVPTPSRKNVKFSPGALFKQYLNGRPLPKKGPVVGKAAKGSGAATADYVKAGVRTRRYVKKGA